jgi:hypothetical protein
MWEHLPFAGSAAAGAHLPAVLDFLARAKAVSELALAHGALPPACVAALAAFVAESDQPSLLRSTGSARS